MLKVGVISAATYCAMIIAELKHHSSDNLKEERAALYKSEFASAILASAIVDFLESAKIDYSENISLESIEPIILANQDKDKEAYERVDAAIKQYRAMPSPPKHGIFCMLPTATLIAGHLLAFREPILDAIINKQYLKLVPLLYLVHLFLC